ncbi:MAG: hypothetical protein QNJ61_17550 [Desulfobacterales bacterium]|nr:hypothetical protein [Desulfobacterales bacterium]
MSTSLAFVLKPDHLAVFFPLLQQGVRVEARVGCDIQSLLCDQFEMAPDYLADRITTIFINGKPVDDAASAVVTDGATLALSAAMPGLVGATLRKAGRLASFRNTISHRNEATPAATCEDGFITLKLFNMLLPEMGPSYLAHGVWTRGRELQACLAGYPHDLAAVLVRLEQDGHALDPTKVSPLEAIAPGEEVRLQATCETVGPEISMEEAFGHQ